MSIGSEYASSPDEHDAFFSNARHKPYRYPEQYPMTAEEGGDA